MKILMTGASGYLGRKLVQRFVQQGHELTLLLRKPLGCAFQKVSEVLVSPICPVPNELIADHDVVLHCATNYGRNGADLEDILWVNYQWPMQLAMGLPDGGVFLHIDTALPAGVSTYAAGKARLRSFLTDRRGLRSCNLRLEHFYGVGDGHFLSHVLSAFFSGQAVLPLTAGAQRRDFMWVDDAVDGIALVLESLLKSSIPGEVALGSGTSRSIREVVQQLSALSSPHTTELQFGAVSMREGEPLESKADLRVLANLGWSPRMPWESGIRHFVEDSRLLWAQRGTLRWLDQLQF